MDDEPEQVIIGQPFQSGPNGQPQPAMGQHPQTGQPQPVSGPQDPLFQKGLHKFYDLTAGRYAVTVSVGKASATKREEGAAALGELIPNLPPEMQMAIMPDYVEQLSFPGAHKIAEKLRKALPPQLQESEDGGPDPEKMAMQQQIQQLQQALDSKMAEENAKQQATIQTAQLKAQTDVQITQAKEAAESQRATLKAQADERAHALDNLVKLAIAEIQSKDRQAEVDAEQARTELGFANEHHAGMNDRTHEAIQAHQDRTHEAMQNELDRQHEQQQGDQDRAVAAIQATQPDGE
jgi:hypothetical protein